eukprot:SAG22_NODE_4639_length_1208_cov_1.192967_2_plen_268_part_00
MLPVPVRARRRLVPVRSALAAAPAGVATGSAGETETVPTASALAHRLAQGELDVHGLSAATLRLLMQPEPGAPTVTEQTLAAQPMDLGLGAEPRPLLDPATGRLLNTEWLEGLRDAAVAAREFHRAAAIHDILEVLRPKPPLSLLDTAPAGVDTKAQFFLDNGFVCVVRCKALSFCCASARIVSKTVSFLAVCLSVLRRTSFVASRWHASRLLGERPRHRPKHPGWRRGATTPGLPGTGSRTPTRATQSSRASFLASPAWATGGATL